MKCDIKIMAVPTRMENVRVLCDKLSLSIQDDVYVDYKMEGKPLKTSRGAYCLPHESDTTHRLVLQDDIEVCNGLTGFCDELVNKYPNAIIALFNSGYGATNAPDNAIFKSNFLYGPAIIIPLHYLEIMYSFLDRTNPEFSHSDWFYSLFASMYQIPMITLNPVCIRHLKLNSEMGHTGKDRVSSPKVFESNPEIGKYRDLVGTSFILFKNTKLDYNKFITNSI